MSPEPSVSRVLRDWLRIGVTGFGGPPAHIALLRRLVVDDRGWIDAGTFEDANAASGLLPGPASTQMAIYCAYRVAGAAGALAGGLAFILPAVIAVTILSALMLGHAPPDWVRGAGAGAGAAVPAVALAAARGLLRPSLDRARGRGALLPWAVYVLAGAAGAVFAGPYLVLVLVACGAAEFLRRRAAMAMISPPLLGLVAGATVAGGGMAALAWTAVKVGALSFGGGFVIIPLMQGDAVHVHHWMTNAQFLNAVALGQVTPGPVVATVAAVGYAAHGVAGSVLAAAIAFAPSFAFVLLAGRRFETLRTLPDSRAFLDGAGPGAIGAIAGAAVTLAAVLAHGWQFAVLGGAVAALLLRRRGVVLTLLAGAGIGVVLALAGVPVA